MTKKQILLYGITVLAYFLIGNVLLELKFVVNFLLSIASRDFWSTYIDITFYSLFAVIFLIICRKELSGYLKDFQKNYKKYPVHIFTAFVIAFTLIVVTAIILDHQGIGKSENDIALDEAAKLHPILEGLSIILIGPFVEEMVFRGGLYERIRRKINDSQK